MPTKMTSLSVANHFQSFLTFFKMP